MFYLQTNSSQFCNIESKTQKKYLIIVITIYSIKKMMTKYKKYREKYVHDDINRNIKAKCQTKKT